jgi:hypothetical protein
MEYFGARPNQPIQVCLEHVRQSDILIVVVAHLYGSVVPSLGRSFVELEYDEGYKLDKSIFVYLKDDSVPVLPSFFERDPVKFNMLNAF